MIIKGLVTLTRRVPTPNSDKGGVSFFLPLFEGRATFMVGMKVAENKNALNTCV